MRVARWRWVLIPMIVVIVGCLPQPTPDLPATFLHRFNRSGRPIFTVQVPPASLTGQGVVDSLRAEDPMFRGRAVPVFGFVDCNGGKGCLPGPGVNAGAATWTVWLVLYPDCTDPTGKDSGWVVVDAAKVGVASILIGTTRATHDRRRHRGRLGRVHDGTPAD